MSDPEVEFLRRWQAEKSAYSAWGHCVKERINSLISTHVDPRQRGHFIRIPASPRLKDDESLVLKAFHRNKNYTSPFDEIEDKVGVRFVLLLAADVRLVGELIETDKSIWTAVKARDHEAEIAQNPDHFGYQSLHYVVRSLADIEYDGITLPADMPCEVQVRTLLQHAYGEVSHDTLYKPGVQTTPEMKRAAAKSMALIEASGDYFDKLAALIAEAVAPLRELDEALSQIYISVVGKHATASETPLNESLLDRYGRDVEVDDLSAWVNNHRYIGKRIAERVATIAAFRVPAILLVYYSVDQAPHGTPVNSPLDEVYLTLIYSDLGRSLTG